MGQQRIVHLHLQAEARAAALEAALSKQQEQTRQAAHQSALARAARDRACQDSVKKEEELVSLKVTDYGEHDEAS